MKVYFVRNKHSRKVYYLSVNKIDVEKYWKYENFDETYYELRLTKSENALKWIQGKIDRSILVKELEA